MATAWGTLVSCLRGLVPGQDAAGGDLTDGQLRQCLAEAVRAYSEQMPREADAEMELIGGQAVYDLPAGALSIISVTDGVNSFTITGVFGGRMTVAPTPANTGVAIVRMLADHTIPEGDAQASSYDGRDEWLVLTLARALALELLAGEAAGHWQYTEGDVSEDRGRAAKQLREEADALRRQFASGVLAARERQRSVVRGGLEPILATTVRRKVAPKGRIYRA